MQNSIHEKTSSISPILARLFATREFRELFNGTLFGILDSWAAQHPFRKKLSRFITSRIEKRAESDLTLGSLLADPLFMEQVNTRVPHLLEGGLNLIDHYLQQFSTLSPSSRQKAIEDLGRAFSSQQASITNSLLKALVSIQEQNPGLLSKQVTASFSAWYSGTDFGEAQDVLTMLKDEFSSLVDQLNDILWKYPGKLLILLGFIPDLFNLVIKSSQQSITRFNQAPPDLIADVIRSLFTGTDPKQLAALLNELSELVNKIQTGSALIGDPGSPELEKRVTGFLRDVDRQTDWSLVNKSRLALARGKDQLSALKPELWNENPAALKREMEHRALLRQIRLGGLNRKLSAIEELPDELFDEWLSGLATGFEGGEAGDLLETVVRLMERVQDSEQASGLLDKFASQFDAYRLLDFFSAADALSSNGLRDLQRAIVPELVLSVCNALAPRDDEFEERAAQARQALCSLLNNTEAGL